MPNAGSDCRYKVSTILNMLTPVVSEFESMNSAFQGSGLNISELYSDLEIFYLSLKGRIYNKEGHRMKMEDMDFGVHFQQKCDKVDPNVAHTVKCAAFKFLQSAIEEVEEEVDGKCQII